MTLFLKDEDVAQCVDMGAMLGAIESMQGQYGDGEAHNMTRRKIITDLPAMVYNFLWNAPVLRCFTSMRCPDSG